MGKPQANPFSIWIHSNSNPVGNKVVFCYDDSMQKKKYFLIWRTGQILLYGFICWFVYYWAIFSYKDYSHIWYYWLVFPILIAGSTFAFLFFFSALKVEGNQLILYRVTGKRVFWDGSIRFGVKEQFGVGRYSFKHFPISIYGQKVTKEGQIESFCIKLVCGFICNQFFRKFYEHSIPANFKS